MNALKKRTNINQKADKYVNNSSLANASRPAGLSGLVNVDNIADREFDIIDRIAKASFERRIQWQPISFIENLINIITKKNVITVYNSKFEGLDIVIKTDARGKISIKAISSSTKKVILDTFIPFIPEIKLGKRIGTSRSFVIYNLFKAVRYQVDGILPAASY